MTILRADDFLFNISRGKVPGHSLVDKFGHVSGLGTTLATIWPQNILYTYSATANITGMSSSNAADTQTVRVIGLRCYLECSISGHSSYWSDYICITYCSYKNKYYI